MSSGDSRRMKDGFAVLDKRDILTHTSLYGTEVTIVYSSASWQKIYCSYSIEYHGCNRDLKWC